MLRPNGKPGLGIEVDKNTLKEFPYERGLIYPDYYPQYGTGIL